MDAFEFCALMLVNVVGFLAIGTMLQRHHDEVMEKVEAERDDPAYEEQQDVARRQ